MLDKKLEKFQFLTGNSIKLLAVFTMVIDHLCKIVLSDYWGGMLYSGQMSWEQYQRIDTLIRFNLQGFGTIAFPLFCFLLSEGFRYTRSKKRYIGIMFVFALISEIPFDIGFFSRYSKMEGTFPFYFNYQNVFFTLFLGLIALLCLERFSCKSEKKSDKIKAGVLQILCISAIAAIAELIRCDYGMEGILFIVVFYLCRESRICQVLLFLLAYIATTGNQPTLYILICCLIILLYNGKRGKLKLKYFFYAFYPIHIMILFALGQVLAI